MADLIDRVELLKNIDCSVVINGENFTALQVKEATESAMRYIINKIADQPQADTERHAHWEKFYVHKCSNCKGEFDIFFMNQEEKAYYCPHCGCKMDEVDND